MATIYLGLGSNLGDRKRNLSQALDMLAQKVKVEQVSSIYETVPVGYEQQPLFLNAVCCISTDLSPEELLNLAKEIESQLGRVPSFPNAPRTIDIDILFYDDKVIKSKSLIVPHPRLEERAFVLVPLAEIASEKLHPGSKKAVGELLNDLGIIVSVHRYAGAEEIMDRRQDVSSIC